jgi:hypothetical protein
MAIAKRGYSTEWDKLPKNFKEAMRRLLEEVPDSILARQQRMREKKKGTVPEDIYGHPWKGGRRPLTIKSSVKKPKKKPKRGGRRPKHEPRMTK